MYWIKFSEREVDFFTLYCIFKNYTVYFKKVIGVNFYDYFAIYQKGIVNSYRGVKQYKRVVTILRKNRSLFYQILCKLDRQNKILDKYNRIRCYTKLSDDDLLKIFKNFVDDYQYYFTLFTLPKYYIFLEDKDLYNKEKKLLRKTRGIAKYEEVQEKFLSLFFRELEKRRKIVKEDLFYCTPDEIISLIRNKILDKRTVHRRKRAVGIFCKKGRVEFLFGERLKKVIKKEIVAQNVGRIIGKVVHPGRVKGCVKIVFKKNDLKNLENKILVTPMTSIRFVPFIKKVKAIITDEGSIACHAAIISRELNIPCIIGTKNATQVLKDGDMVAVDADKGEVKIIT